MNNTYQYLDIRVFFYSPIVCEVVDKLAACEAVQTVGIGCRRVSYTTCLLYSQLTYSNRRIATKAKQPRVSRANSSCWAGGRWIGIVSESSIPGPRCGGESWPRTAVGRPPIEDLGTLYVRVEPAMPLRIRKEISAGGGKD